MDRTAKLSAGVRLLRIRRRSGPPIIWLNRKPLFFEGGCIPIKISIIRKGIVLLSPVNKLNSFPKGFKLKVQGDFLMGDNFENADGLVTPQGITYLWLTSINT